MEFIFDIEADGLHPTKIHVLSVCDLKTGKIKSTNDYDAMRRFFQNKDTTIIGHNIIRYDIPVVERLLEIKVLPDVVDTLPLSWYLEFDRPRHGLETWGETFGVPKPEIEDWENLSYEEYRHRCEEDVKINTKLWEQLSEKLHKLYSNVDEVQRCIKYLNFKMECAALQEKSKWRLDVQKTKSFLQEMEQEKEAKIEQLKQCMPKVPVTAKRNKPKLMYRNDGQVSKNGKKWFDLLRSQGMDLKYDGVVEEITGYDEPNPSSHKQMKDWLFSLGWEPQTFKYKNEDNGKVKSIPQINLEHGEGLCPSIKELYDKEPNLEVLDGLYVILHRISILKGFLDNVDDKGYVVAGIQGLTNTMRFKHSVCVNLPGVDKPYGDIVRGVLIADDEYELCGSDMSSLEDRTKQHYMWQFDPEYVKDMMKDGFDPHLDLAVFAGKLTEEQAQAHKDKTENHGNIRKLYKGVNYALIASACKTL